MTTITDLPAELILLIYESCPTTGTAAHLAATNKKLYSLWTQAGSDISLKILWRRLGDKANHLVFEIASLEAESGTGDKARVASLNQLFQDGREAEARIQPRHGTTILDGKSVEAAYYRSRLLIHYGQRVGLLEALAQHLADTSLEDLSACRSYITWTMTAFDEICTCTLCQRNQFYCHSWSSRLPDLAQVHRDDWVHVWPEFVLPAIKNCVVNCLDRAYRDRQRNIPPVGEGPFGKVAEPGFWARWERLLKEWDIVMP